MRQFLEICKPTPQTRVLDVGGNPRIWATVPPDARPQIVYLNMPRSFEEGDDRQRLVFGDGTRLPFPNQSFELVFSNSVIEHVGEEGHQQAFADEIRRVGRRFWVQTPNRGFPIEQHLLTPFLHWLPMPLRATVARRFTVWQLLTRPQPESRRFYVDHFLNDIRLLDRNQLTRLFPGAQILAEPFGPLTKSWIAYRS
jgi:hypothetical protein